MRRLFADKCKLFADKRRPVQINAADCKQDAQSPPMSPQDLSRKWSLRPFIKWLGMSSQPLGRASKRGTPETCPKSSDMRLRFDKGKRSNMFPKQAVSHCKTPQTYMHYLHGNADMCRLFADACRLFADKCRPVQINAADCKQDAQSPPMSPQDLSRRGRCDPS